MLDVLESGAAAVGFVRPLFDPEMIRKKNYDDIRHRAEAIVERLASF
jgi:2-keto-3-deoxy-6-phosphogluconate aldolase